MSAVAASDALSGWPASKGGDGSYSIPSWMSLRDLRSGKFGDDAECEVNSRSDAARSEDIAVAHDSRLFVTGADQGQQVDVGPMRRSPTPLQQPGCTKKKGAHANRGYILCVLALAANEVDRLDIGEGFHNAWRHRARKSGRAADSFRRCRWA